MTERHPGRRRVRIDAIGTHPPVAEMVDIRDLHLTLVDRPVTEMTAGVAAALRPAAVARAERPRQEPTEATRTPFGFPMSSSDLAAGGERVLGAAMPTGLSLPLPTGPSDGVVAFGLHNINREGARLPSAPAPMRYATIGRVQELLRLSGTRVVQLRNQDPRFPAPAVEIHEQRLVRAGWREADISAYKRGKESLSAGEPEQYLGYSAIGGLLGVTAERVRQLERSDPSFPLVAVELVGASTRRTRRQVVHKGWRRQDIDVYVAARSSRQSASDGTVSRSAGAGRVP